LNIVFDLDGTLIDSAPDIQSVASDILCRLGKAALTLDETRSFIGEGAGVFVRRMMAARDIADTPERHSELHQRFVRQYETELDQAVFYPGVFDTLVMLKDSGHRLGLCTNKPERPARAVIKHMGLEPFFDAFIAGGMLPRSKPEPDMLLKIIKDMSAGPTLYVGDSEIDAETAMRAGVPFALFSEGYRKRPVSEIDKDWTFDHFDALPGIVAHAWANCRT
jgi:phosphoglycolate phosphatase